MNEGGRGRLLVVLCLSLVEEGVAEWCWCLLIFFKAFLVVGIGESVSSIAALRWPVLTSYRGS